MTTQLRINKSTIRKIGKGKGRSGKGAQQIKKRTPWTEKSRTESSSGNIRKSRRKR